MFTRRLFKMRYLISSGLWALCSICLVYGDNAKLQVVVEPKPTQVQKAQCIRDWANLESRIEKNPAQDGYWDDYKSCVIVLNRSQAGIAFSSKIAARYPKLHSPHTLAGILLMGMKRYDQAINQFEQACAIFPNNVHTKENLCTAYVITRHLDKAVPFCKEAVEKDPARVENYQMLAGAYMGLREIDKEGEIAQEGIRKFPEDANLLGLLGNSLLFRGKYNEAKPFFQKALKFQPGDISALYGLGQAMLYSGNVEEAATITRKLKALRADEASDLELRIRREKNK